MTREILSELGEVENQSDQRFGQALRFKLASIAAGLGAVDRVVRALTWQEFENYAEESLIQTGFKTRKGLVFNDGTRRWQIDITATKNQTLLALDCKHWQSPAYASRLEAAIKHQKESLSPLVQYMRENGLLAEPHVSALPVIVTLFEPRESFLDNVVIVSVGQLQDFLEHLSPFNPEVPFIAFQ